MRYARISFSLLSLLLLFLAFSFTNPAVLEAADDLSMEVRAGFNGYARMGQAFPLQIMLENNGAELNGRLEVSINNDGSRIVQSKKVSLAPGSKKRVLMYIPTNNGNIGNVFNVKLMSGNRKVSENKARITVVQPQELVVGVLASEASTLNHLAAIKLTGQDQRITVIHLQAEDIPVNSLLLDNIDVLALNNFSSSALSSEQLAGIQSWVERGGMMVLAGGVNWQKTLSVLPEAFLPVKVDGSKTLNSFPQLEKWLGERLTGGSKVVVSTGTLQKGNPLVMEGNTPFIIHNEMGRGNIIYMAFDLAMEPFASWSGNQKMWLDLMSTCDPHNVITNANARRDMVYRQDEMRWMLRNIPASDLPAGGTLAVFLLFYLLILGPGVYLLLKKIDRRDLGWIAIPLLAVCLFTFTYMFGFKTKGRDVFTNVISIVKMEPDFDYAQITSSIGVFAPTKRDCSLNFNGEKLISVYPIDDRGYSRSVMMTNSISDDDKPVVATVFQDREGRVSFEDSSRWSMRSIRSEEIVPKAGEITGTLQSENGHIKGTIVNNTARNLVGCVVFSRYGYQRIGDMAPGASVEVDFIPRVSASNMGPIFYRIFNSYPVHRPQGFRDRPSREEQISQQAIEMLSNSADTLSESLLFFGRSDEELAGILPDEKAGKSYYTTIYLSPQNLSLTDGRMVSVPPGIINGRLISSEAQNVHQDSWGMDWNEGRITLQMDLPFSIDNLEIDELKLLLGLDQRRSRIAQLEIYNWDNGQWEEIRYQPIGIAIADWKEHISEAGALRLRIGTPDDQKDRYMRINGASLTLEGHYLNGESQRSQGSGKISSSEIAVHETGEQIDAQGGGE